MAPTVKQKISVFVIFGVLVGIIAAIIVYGAPEPGTTEIEASSGIIERGSVSDNSPAPVFSLPDLSGEFVSLGDYRGRVVIISFWTTWCVPCREEMPILDEFNREHGEDIIVVGVNEGDRVQDIHKFVSDVNVTYPVLIDEKGIVGATYHVVGYPTTYFLDTAGIIRGKYVGSITRRIIQQYLTPLGINQ